MQSGEDQYLPVNELKFITEYVYLFSFSTRQRAEGITEVRRGELK